MALSPWPPATSAANRSAAVIRLREAVGGRTYIDLGVKPRIAEIEAIGEADRTTKQVAQLAADKEELGRADAVANALGEAAAAMVENYAPGAPQPIKDEALIRFAGYLAGADYGGIVSETSVASAQVEYVTNHSAMFRNSGAAGLLTNWKIRRAGAIG